MTSAAELVRQSNASLAAALAAGEVDAISSHFADDVVFMMPGSPLSTGGAR